MTRLQQRLDELRSAGRKALVPFVTAGDPSLAATVPVIRTEYLAGGLLEPDPYELDVAAIHQAFLRGFRARGGKVISGAPITRLDRDGGRWTIRAGGESLEADVVVNAAGAWVDGRDDMNHMRQGAGHTRELRGAFYRCLSRIGSIDQSPGFAQANLHWRLLSDETGPGDA